MASKGDVADRPPAMSPAKVFANQTAIPALIDAAATVEARLERLSVAARRSPLIAMLAAAGFGWVLVSTFARRRTGRF